MCCQLENALANLDLLDVQHLLTECGPQPACVLTAQPTKNSPMKYLVCHDNARGARPGGARNSRAGARRGVIAGSFSEGMAEMPLRRSLGNGVLARGMRNYLYLPPLF